MKIYIEHSMNESGKGKFLQRLTKEWDKTGVKWSLEPKGCDARLALTRFRHDLKLPTVLRIDGAHMEIKSPKERAHKSLKWKNKETATSIEKSKAVIWQSEFCKRIGRHVFGIKPKREYVIFNGADPADYLERTNNRNIVLSAYWVDRPHKRLKEMLKVCIDYCTKHADVKVRVLGQIEENVPRHPNIEYCGHLCENDMKIILADSAVMLNLAWFDWCPNAVVEALVSGLPVICTAGHGVEEIVKRSGIVLPLDARISKKLPRNMKPPKIDYQVVNEALDIVLEPVLVKGKQELVEYPKPEHLHIKKIARQYAEVFNDILK